jgi:hypothetical protein
MQGLGHQLSIDDDARICDTPAGRAQKLKDNQSVFRSSSYCKVFGCGMQGGGVWRFYLT